MPETLEHDLERYFGALADRVGHERRVDPEPTPAPDRRPRRAALAMAAAVVVVVAGAVAVLFAVDRDPADVPPAAETTVDEPPDTTPETSDTSVPTDIDAAPSPWRTIDAPWLDTPEREPVAVWMALDFFILYPTNEGRDPIGARINAITGEARPLPPPPFGWRAGVTAAWSGREVLVVGGSSGEGTAPFGAAYDPVEDTWRAIEGPAGVDPADVAQGYAGGVWAGDELVFWATGWAYDPEADSWRSLPPPPLSARTGAAATAIGSDILVWGGCEPVVDCYTDPETWLTDGALWSASTGEWTVLPAGPLGGAPYATAVSDGIGATIVTGHVAVDAPDDDDVGDAATRFVPGQGWGDLPDPPAPVWFEASLTQVGRSVALVGPAGDDRVALVLHPGDDEWTSFPVPEVGRAVADGRGHLLAVGAAGESAGPPQVVAVEELWSPLAAEPIEIDTRVEIHDGVPFAVTTKPEFPPGAVYISRWHDGRLRSRTSAIAGSTWGTRLPEDPADYPVEERLVVEDIDMYPIAATDPVTLTLP